jgi:hypothetical protein
MSQNDEDRTDSEEEERRRERAEELHKEIEELKSRSPSGEPDREPSPREFTDESAKNEISGEPCDDDS